MLCKLGQVRGTCFRGPPSPPGQPLPNLPHPIQLCKVKSCPSLQGIYPYRKIYGLRSKVLSLISFTHRYCVLLTEIWQGFFKFPYVDFPLLYGILIMEVNMFRNFLIIVVASGGVHLLFDVPPVQAVIIGLLTLVVVLLMELEQVVLEQVAQLKQKHKCTWRDKPQWYWMLGLLEEVVELGLTLIGLHEGPVEWELLQIAAICLNWIEYRQKQLCKVDLC